MNLLRTNMNQLQRAILVLMGIIYNTKAYNIDVLEVASNTTMPHIIENTWKVVRPSRGVFGVSGLIDIKEDIDTDGAILEVKIFYSPNGISYQLSPFRIPQQSVTQAFNRPYKEYLMDAMIECCKNAPEVEVFVSPLTKRLVDCNDCLFPSENFPTAMRPGYYRLVVKVVYKGATAAVSVLLKVELD